jgi:hypothetical protein
VLLGQWQRRQPPIEAAALGTHRPVIIHRLAMISPWEAWGASAGPDDSDELFGRGRESSGGVSIANFGTVRQQAPGEDGEPTAGAERSPGSKATSA